MRLVILAILVSGVASAQTAEMYRSVAEDGTVIFSDRPQGENYELVAVAARPGSRTRQQEEPAAEAPPPAAEPEVASGASAEEFREQLARSCALAREQYNALMVSDRLFRVRPDGETEYLNEEELAEARSAAQAQVARWCE